MENKAQAHGIGQIEQVPHQGQIAPANILVAALHWAAGLAHPSLAAQDLMHKALAPAGGKHRVVPKDKEVLRTPSSDMASRNASI